ncbi:MAG: TIGR03111 family XrtG-associated glycosyltransferase [Clostridium sp.]
MEYEFLRQVIFWGVWLFIPTLLDVIIGLYIAIKVTILNFINKKSEEEQKEYEDYYEPLVSIIIPVYNSEKSLKRCVDSVINQSYSISNMEIILVDNGSRDNSFSVFNQIQVENRNLRIWWYKSGKGKAKALNTGLYYARGKYIINIDSDGSISENCIKSFVSKFEKNPHISAMTGSVIIDYNIIKETEGIFKRLLGKCEFMEYLEVFFIGRNNQGMNNDIFTMAGAVSAIRREVIAKSQMYNSSTLGEDAHMTQQIIRLQGGVVSACKEAIFYTDPIEDIDKLCVQRQRWQRGALEVAGLFYGKRNDFKRKAMFKMLLSDHAMTFPKFIWIFAILYLGLIGYPMKMILTANLIIYCAYSLLALVSILCTVLLMDDLKELRKYTLCHVLIFMIMPLYRTIVLFFRIGGIINSLSTKSEWSGRGIKEEFKLGMKAIFFIKSKKAELEDESIEESKSNDSHNEDKFEN